jgi:YggT family protein
MTALILTAIVWFFRIIRYAILARILISWLPIPRDNQFIRLLYQVTEPILGPVRALIEKSALGKNMMVDFSPVVAFLLLSVIERILYSIF